MKLEQLSPELKAVARLVRSGYCTSDIAQALGVTINNVKMRLTRLFKVYGVTNREELVGLMLLPLDSTHRSAIEQRNRRLYRAQ